MRAAPKTILLLLATAAAAVSVGAGSAASTSSSLTFAPVADARVEEGNAASNYGTSSRLLVDGSPQMRSYLTFAVSGVGSAVERATLRLYAFDKTVDGPAVYGAASGWSETSVTWNSKPERTTEALDDKGAIADESWVEFDVTRLVTGNGTYSFALYAMSGDGVDFYSRDHGDRRPELVLSVADGSSAPAPAPAPTSPPPPSGGTTTDDNTPPSVAISAPTDGTTYTVAQTATIAASASDNMGVARVEFYSDGALRGSDTSAPWSYTWPVSSSANGTHRWTAVAKDAKGNATTSAPVSVTVNIAAAPAPTGGGSAGAITATAETEPVAHSGDAADDPAIWIHPSDTALSTVIATDKLGGLGVYDLTGKKLFFYADSKPNNVDLRYNFPLSGKPTTIVATSDRTNNSLRIYRVNPATRGLEHVSARTISVGIGLYGLCMYRSPSSGKYYVFDSDSSGTIQQWELYDNGAGKVDARKVRQFKISSVVEGCVADDETGALYAAQEDVAIWKYGAEPDTGTVRTQVDKVGTGGHLTADIEGLSIYYMPGGRGYLLASSQGSNDFAVYERQGANAYLTRFSVAAGAFDAVSYTDGFDVTNFPLGSAYGEGLFVSQDDKNDVGYQNFKLVPWNRIARGTARPLEIDTSWDPRRVGASGETPAPVSPPADGGGSTTPPPPDSGSGSAEAFYVDDTAGNDANAGTSPAAAWRTLARATSATLAPGQSLLLKRGGVWSGPLEVAESGTSAAPIVIGAYGSGARPVIQGGSTCVVASGSYATYRDLHVDDCSWAGIGVSGSGIRLEANLITRHVAGIYIRSGALGTAVLGNELRDNNKMSVLNPSSGDDSGAFGILLHGDGSEIAHNTISGSDAFSFDYGRDGAAIEIVGGQNNNIHHNVAIDNDAFSELAGSRAADNTFAYNVIRSSLDTSVGFVTRGAGSSYGPVLRTRLYNNTVYLSGASSEGFICHAGCSTDVLRMRNNVVWAIAKAGYADAAFDEDYNLFWGGRRQFTLGAHSVTANPLFVGAANWNLRLNAGSPAVDRGVELGYTSDADGRATPSDGNGDGIATADLGAYER